MAPVNPTTNRTTLISRLMAHHSLLVRAGREPALIGAFASRYSHFRRHLATERCRGVASVAHRPYIIQHEASDLEGDYDDWFSQTRNRLASVRGTAECEPALREICREAFRTHEMAPSELVDYMVVSTPGVFEEAGYSEPEMDSLVHVLDRIVEEEWAARRTG